MSRNKLYTEKFGGLMIEAIVELIANRLDITREQADTAIENKMNELQEEFNSEDLEDNV